MKFVFLFETLGYASAPFTQRGHETYIIDILNTGTRAINTRATHVLDWNILEREKEIIDLCVDSTLIFGFPPCTDLASSGSRHFAKKRSINPSFQEEAVYLARSVERIGETVQVPWAIENPVGVMSTLWRKPDHYFDPYHYGGYLPEDDIHPDFPQYIAPRDAYPKNTCVWKGQGFTMPPRKLVSVQPGYSTQHKKLGGSSLRTKIIRSATPRGFFEALAQQYCGE